MYNDLGKNMEQLANMNSTDLSKERITPKIALSAEKASEILNSFGLTLTDSVREVGGGRIANNLIAKTKEQGDVIIRLYPKTYGISKVAFEADVLRHFSDSGVMVPAPINLTASRQNFNNILQLDEIDIFVYRALPGKTLTQDQLSVPVAKVAGAALYNLVSASVKYQPTKLLLHGNLGFISGLLRAAKERDAAFAMLPVAAEMETIITDKNTVESLAKTSKGIVHADFFFENLLLKDGNVTGILDFGDAYYGHVVNDAIIGAMEFSVQSDETWNINMWHSFMQENSPWLKHEPLSPELMRSILLANCIRFAVYTLPFTQQEGLPIETNKYIQRFLAIKHDDLGEKLEESFENAIGK